MVMAVRALQGLIVLLVAVAGFEVGTLRRPLPPEPRIVFTEAAPIDPSPVARCPSPVPGLLFPEVSLTNSAPPPATSRPRKGKRPHGTEQIPGTGSVADCAQNGGPLCGMPE
ncbi:MAG TPA: hypothetical protein VIG06_07445 [Kofleriaceae bacterium]|jgi:hypothetical protein